MENYWVLKMLITIFFDNIFHRRMSLIRKKIFYQKKKQLSLLTFFLENCRFRALECQKMQKVSPPGILSLQLY